MQATLEHRGTDALDELNVWLKTARERLAWCRDASGDRYSVDAKLAIVKDLVGQLEHGEEKLRQAENKVDIIKRLVGEQRCRELEQGCEQTNADWQTFVAELHNTK